MSRSYVALHFDFLEMTEALTEAELGRLVKAMLAYGRDGRADEGALVGNERFLFPVFRRQIDRDVNAYETRALQSAVNGRRGGRPRKYDNDEKNQAGFLETEKTQEQEQEQDQEQEEEKEQEKEHDKAGEGRRAPALREVLDYCGEKKLSVNGEAFWNYYESNGWQAGDRPIRNWKAKLREWAAREKAPPPDTAFRRADSAAPGARVAPGARAAPGARVPPANPALNYAQREYVDDDRYFVDLDRYGGKY